MSSGLVKQRMLAPCYDTRCRRTDNLGGWSGEVKGAEDIHSL